MIVVSYAKLVCIPALVYNVHGWRFSLLSLLSRSQKGTFSSPWLMWPFLWVLHVQLGLPPPVLCFCCNWHLCLAARCPSFHDSPLDCKPHEGRVHSPSAFSAPSTCLALSWWPVSTGWSADQQLTDWHRGSLSTCQMESFWEFDKMTKGVS